MLLLRSVSAHARHGDDRLQPAQMGILMRLGNGACTISDLAQYQAVRLPTMSRSVAVLVKAGLVKRWTPEDNRRITMLTLTPVGRRKLRHSKRKAEKHVTELLQNLSDEECQQVDAALATLIRVMV